MGQKRTWRDVGLLVIRVGVGVMFMVAHGGPKLLGGPSYWEQVGSMGMGSLGVATYLGFWGFMAGFSEFFGGLALATGLLFRPFLVLLLCVMAAATHYHLTNGDPLGVYSRPIEMGMVFVGLFIAGPGHYTLWPLVRRLWSGKEQEEPSSEQEQ